MEAAGVGELAGGDPAFFIGPHGGTERSTDGALRWVGLSIGDEEVLSSLVRGLGVVPDELHTHVPLGVVPECAEFDRGVAWRRMVGEMYLFRADAALRFGDEWWIVECKPLGSLHGLGQLLGYFYLWCRGCGDKRVSRLVLACRDADAMCCEVCVACGVDVVVV